MNDYVMQKGAGKPAANKSPGREITGRTVLFSLIAFFAVVASVNGYMMSVAIRTMPGLDTKSSYEASQTYNAEIVRAQEQEARGWRADVTLGKADDAGVTVRLTDRSGAPVQGLAMKTKLAHPADRNADVVAEATEVSPGVYAAKFAQAHGGAWDLVLEGREGSREVFRSRSRIKL